MVNWRKKVPGNGHNKPTWLFLQIRKSPAMNCYKVKDEMAHTVHVLICQRHLSLSSIKASSLVIEVNNSTLLEKAEAYK